MRLFGRRRDPSGLEVHYEHPTQPLAAGFLRAIAEGRPRGAWEVLSHESRGLLEGRYASHAGVRLAHAAGAGEAADDERLAAIAAPVLSSVVTALGGIEALNATGVSAARILSRYQAFVLLVPGFESDAPFVAEEDWKPRHLLGFVYEDREWRLDLGLTAGLSDEAGLVDPLGEVR